MKIVNCKLKIITHAFATLFVIGIPLFVNAASFYFTVPKDVVFVGEDFEVTLMLDPEGETLNTLAGKIKLPKDTFFLRDFHTGDSIVDLWVENPKEENGTVTFSGIIPGGFDGIHEAFMTASAPGKVLTLLMRAHAPGTAVFSLENPVLLAHDGKGTSVTPTLTEGKIVVQKGNEEKQAGRETGQEAVDMVPPELFQVTVTRDPALYDNKWTAVFATQDKETGVDYYEIAEQRTGDTQSEAELDWVRAESPYELRDQERTSVVYVKAVDAAGNVRIVHSGTGSLGVSRVDKSMLILTGVGILSMLLLVLFSRKRKH